MKPNGGIKFIPEPLELQIACEATELQIGKVRQVLGNVASNVDVIVSEDVEERMIKFMNWLLDNRCYKVPSDFTPEEKEAVIQKIEELNGIAYPLGRLFHGNPNHIQTYNDLFAQARKAFRNGI